MKSNILTIAFIVFAIASIFFSNNIFKQVRENRERNESVENIKDSPTITAAEETANLITKFEIYMPKEVITEASIDEKIFLTIKNLVLEKSIFSDNGVISYFRYEFADTISESGMNILVAENIEETYHFVNTDIEKINGIVLRKELYLDKGAIFYYTYKF